MTTTGVTLVQVLWHGERPGRNESRGPKMQNYAAGIGVVRVPAPWLLVDVFVREVKCRCGRGALYSWMYSFEES